CFMAMVASRIRPPPPSYAPPAPPQSADSEAVAARAKEALQAALKRGNKASADEMQLKIAQVMAAARQRTGTSAPAGTDGNTTAKLSSAKPSDPLARRVAE
ncbi:unnamed protein product, partial [Polarella glacialis]